MTYVRILIDKSDETALALSESIEEKVREWLPFSEISQEAMRTLIDDAEDIVPGIWTVVAGGQSQHSLHGIGVARALHCQAPAPRSAHGGPCFVP